MDSPERNNKIDREPSVHDVGSLDDCRRALIACRQESEKRHDALLRARADYENLRKRAARDMEDIQKFAVADLLEALLPVLDSLELGLTVAQKDAETDGLRQGVELTLGKLSDVLGEFGVEIIDPQGEPFDPEKHEAVMTQHSHEFPVNYVFQVHQKGYMLNNRLIRPARVSVTTN